MTNVFLFHLKSSFRSRDIQMFVFLSSPLFLPVSHCFGGCLKINLKVYDVINCLNMNVARLHETRSELKPVWNLKPLWNVVPFTLQFTWRFHCGNVIYMEISLNFRFSDFMATFRTIARFYCTCANNIF